MSSLYLGNTGKIKSYGAVTKGKSSVVKIEVDIADPYDLAGVLKDLEAMQAEGKLRRAIAAQGEDQ